MTNGVNIWYAEHRTYSVRCRRFRLTWSHDKTINRQDVYKLHIDRVKIDSMGCYVGVTRSNLIWWCLSQSYIAPLMLPMVVASRHKSRAEETINQN